MNAYFAMLGLSGGELILIAVVALVLFGANKIPTFMKRSEEHTSELQSH